MQILEGPNELNVVMTPVAALALDFYAITVNRVGGQPFVSIGTDPDGVPFGVLGERVVQTSPVPLTVEWVNKSVSLDQYSYRDAGFEFWLLNSDGTTYGPAPLWWGMSGLAYPYPALPYNAVANMAVTNTTGGWAAGYYDGWFVFALQMYGQSSPEAQDSMGRFRVKNMLYVTQAGSR